VLADYSEVIVGEWMTTLLPHGGGRYQGKLIVTNQRILFTGSLNITYAGTKYYEKCCIGDKVIRQCIEIKRKQIQEIEVKACFMSKKIVIHLTCGAAYVIDHGGASITRLINAITELKAD
jgi:hypothetical protein